ncbi:hypothetical protein [Sorangium sp. So ce693]|uniref:hypothetical protein n=1 Tax=Sorangium sp. So ce693 TaxID=3133318 RepID=UPI003F5F7AB5
MCALSRSFAERPKGGKELEMSTVLPRRWPLPAITLGLGEAARAACCAIPLLGLSIGAGGLGASSPSESRSAKQRQRRREAASVELGSVQDPAPTQEEQIVADDLRAAVRAVLGELPERDQAAQASAAA